MALLGAGARESLIRLEVGTKVVDATSGETTSITWALRRHAWANLRQPNGNESFRAQQLVAKVNAIFNLRYPDARDISPTETWSIVYAGRRYDITAVVAPTGVRLRTELDLYAFARAE